MSNDTIEARVSLRRYWRMSLSQQTTVDIINKVEGEGSTGKSAAGRWFLCFSMSEILISKTKLVQGRRFGSFDEVEGAYQRFFVSKSKE
ncbi:hypothetical protein KIN20_035017 [Parelaphostrongylus tenuis]|uniref:Uncharacterized protein n=1 Tax=Parelaphostrongylus tenuis TaxID=148309 RepID=A0AAD5WJD9_PARTN|nr:hypothetical protein KIN20_035017 [Parelaphostrongylus tenuis]